MRYFVILSILLFSGLTSGCNTVSGFGQDLSETGKALDRAAYWSQNQIQDLDSESTNTSETDETTVNNGEYNPSAVVVQEPDNLRQY